MGEWKECTISDLGEVVGGATPSTKKPENYENGDIPWITPKDLSTFSGRYIFHGERNITEIGLNSCSTRFLPKNTVLFSSRAPIGYVAIAAKEMCTNQGFKSVIPNDSTDFMFLYYLLKFNKDNIENMGSGTTFKEVSGNTMRSIKVRVPVDLGEQRKIAAMLSRIDDKIELNTRINENLEQQISEYFKSAFPDVLNSTGTDTLEKIISLSNGKKRPNEIGNIPVFGGNGILAYTNKSNSSNCVIIGRVGAYCGNVSLSLGDCWISDNAISAKSKITESQLFIFNLLKNAALPNRHIGTGQPLMTQGILNSILCNIPTIEKINDFESNVIPLQSLVSANIVENQCLVALRDMLIPKLMNGEIDVSEVHI